MHSCFAAEVGKYIVSVISMLVAVKTARVPGDQAELQRGSSQLQETSVVAIEACAHSP